MEKHVVDLPDWFKIEMWLVSLKTHYEYEALIQPPHVSGLYVERAKEIGQFLDKMWGKNVIKEKMSLKTIKNLHN